MAKKNSSLQMSIFDNEPGQRPASGENAPGLATPKRKQGINGYKHYGRYVDDFYMSAFAIKERTW